VKYVFGNTTTQREKKLNPHANTPAAVKMNEINPKYENIHSEYLNHCLTNQIEILPLYLVKGTVQSVLKYLRQQPFSFLGGWYFKKKNILMPFVYRFHENSFYIVCNLAIVKY
jgi:hypothetical protein